MFTGNLDRTITQLCLSLWSLSTRRVEALPKVRVWEPHEVARLVTTSSATRAGDFL